MASKLTPNGQPNQVSVGDQAFMPRERFDFERLKSTNLELQKIDIFSLGLILYLMMAGRGVPQKGQEWEDHRDPAVLRLRLNHLSYSDKLKEMVLKCLCVKATERPSAEQLLVTSCSIRREIEAIDQCNIRRQTATLNRRMKEFQSTVQSPTTSSQFIPFKPSIIFQETGEANQREVHERISPHLISKFSDQDQGDTRDLF